MAFPQGINFRGTSGYVTDPANYDPELTASGNGDYPRTTAQGNTVGWETMGGGLYQTRDRLAANDPRLAGTNRTDNTQDIDFRIDLPASGNYNIGLAAGDASYSWGCAIDLLDTNSNLGHLSTGSTSGAQRFKDATDTEYTNVTWPTSQTLVSKTFSTTICRVRALATVGGSEIASFWVAVGAASGPAIPVLTRQYRTRWAS